MSAPRSLILTIGHSNHTLADFVALLKLHNVSALADVRSAPFSRFNPQFNKDPLASSLKLHGITYVFLGQELGARSDDPSCYDAGRVQYSRLVATEQFQKGLERLLSGSQVHRIALVCAEKEPLECHRTLLVARALDDLGVPVAHILADGRLESHADAMLRLLDLVGVPREDLFRSRLELIADALARQEDRVAYVDARLAEEAEEAEQ